MSAQTPEARLKKVLEILKNFSWERIEVGDIKIEGAVRHLNDEVLCHILDENRKTLCGVVGSITHGGPAIATCVECLQLSGKCRECGAYHDDLSIHALRKELAELKLSWPGRLAELKKEKTFPPCPGCGRLNTIQPGMADSEGTIIIGHCHACHWRADTRPCGRTSLASGGMPCPLPDGHEGPHTRGDDLPSRSAKP